MNAYSASRYSTFCERAGEDPADLEAQQANAWLRARRLPQLPPVDGVSHWAALSGRSAPPRSEVHLSAQALLVARGRALYKIVTGASSRTVAGRGSVNMNE